MSFSLLFLQVLTTLFININNGNNITGNHIYIHMITHSHDDTGWLQTTDEYYVHEVQWIFDTIIANLMKNSSRKFMEVEIAFFSRWFNEQNNVMKNNVIKLINNNQLQFNLNGWCMNDEANPTFNAEINQMTNGAQYMNYNFGEKAFAKSGWHVDPFGESHVTAGIFIIIYIVLYYIIITD